MMDQKQEMVDDVMDDLMDDEIDDEEEEEIDQVVSQVLDEIGAQAPARAAVALGGGGAGNVGLDATGDEDELQARLNSLKKGT
ncbi:hypothetical protein PMKS-003347 [Pichia membranifaciens]|uniref:Uncharacterized protein n=1 Tax=Pichia membranifaciens TaxID=4926 RepID=A0A1Q2YJX1_9ASCO|nr:hypothetical protein PMKS-003347 [Pichia membranifaciens]